MLVFAFCAPATGLGYYDHVSCSMMKWEAANVSGVGYAKNGSFVLGWDVVIRFLLSMDEMGRSQCVGYAKLCRDVEATFCGDG